MANPHTPRAILYQHNQRTSSSSTAIFPLCHTTVCLHNWWLIKTKKDFSGLQLGVGGFAYREGRGKRVFHSEAIAKRHDANTLETVDGITITMIGFIDLPHTRQNGFPSKVCDRFLIGFPYDWEEYAALYCGEKSSEESVSSGISGLDGSHLPSSDDTNSTLPTSFDDLPVNWVRDLLMSTTDDSEYSALSTIIFNDILRNCGGDSVPDKTPRHHDKTMVDQKHKDNNCVYSTSMRAQETRKVLSQSEKGVDVYSTSMKTQKTRKSQSQIQSEKGVDVYKLSKGVATRSMTRSKNLTNKEENLSNRSVSSSELEDSNASLFGEKMQVKENPDKSSEIICDMRSRTRKNASNISHTNMLSGEGKEVKEPPAESSIRSSKRQKNIKK